MNKSKQNYHLKTIISIYFKLFGINNFKLFIKRREYEGLYKDLFEKCFIRVDETIQFTKIEKKEIDEIILVGGKVELQK